MKITGIEIGEYRQFKNIKFDFTYPAGHPKEGQPLEKVCFIGQSGTGKTTLLNVIWFIIRSIDTAKTVIDNNIQKMGTYAYDRRNFLKDLLLSYDGEGEFISKLDFSIKVFDEDIHFTFDTWNNSPKPEKIKMKLASEVDDVLYLFHDKIKNYKLGLYVKDSISREADAFLFDQKEQPQTFSELVKTTSQIENDKAAYQEWIDNAGSRKVVSLGDLDSLSTWQYLLKDINQYDEDTPTFMVNLGRKAQGASAAAVQELQEWLAKNPRIELGEKCLQPLLNKLFLEVDPAGGSNAPIALRTKGGVKIDNKYLSTGTRQLLATAIPIYKFDTNGTVILFDEPERSLFPDIQRELIKYYTGLAPEAQFFFATHSPIIASAFEPCERFILYFNENGEVKFHNGVAPEGDDPNDILSEDFGMDELMLKPGLDAYERYRNLAVEIRNEKDPKHKEELIVERAKLGDSYRF